MKKKVIDIEKKRYNLRCDKCARFVKKYNMKYEDPCDNCFSKDIAERSWINPSIVTGALVYRPIKSDINSNFWENPYGK